MTLPKREANAWDECHAFACYMTDGRAEIVSCDRGQHAEKGDATAMHHDPRLNLEWRYADAERGKQK